MEKIIENEIVMAIITMFGAFFLVLGLPILITMFGKVYGNFIRKINQLDKTDLENTKEYYREILKTNSPLILGYLDKLELNKNIIIAELLYLKKKNIIEIKDSRIEKNMESTVLHTCEEDFLLSIVNGKLVIKKDFFFNLRELVACEAKELKYVKEHKKTKIRHGKVLFFVVSYIFAIIITLFFAFTRNEIEFVKTHIIYTLFASLFYMPMSMMLTFFTLGGFFAEKDKAGLIYKRTTKGRELNQKLEGLKNYLKDYSLMDEREAKEIELWDDYLIYSVMFGQNKKIIEEYEKYIEIIE